MLVDFHTHLHSYSNITDAIECININKIISVACSVDIRTFLQSKLLGTQSQYIIPTFGIHPMNTSSITNLSELDSYLNESQLIGEIGLDYYWFSNIKRNSQIKIFEYILEHCNKTKKYCVIHTKGAEEDVLSILRNFPNAKPIIHWYNGPKSIFKKMINLQYYFTFSCEVYYSDYIKSLLFLTPLDLILAETDNPSSEIWLGGNSDSPLLINRVINDISKVKQIHKEKMEEIIFKNSLEIFGNEISQKFF